MLIKCPECNKEVSDKAESCIHCGYPLNEISRYNSCRINNVKYDLSSELEKVLNNESMLYVISDLRTKCNMTFNDARTLYDIINNTKKVPTEYILGQQYNPTTPKCPTCQSTNLAKIGSMERVGSIATFGLFSKKINKTFKCKSCGYTF